MKKKSLMIVFVLAALFLLMNISVVSAGTIHANAGSEWCQEFSQEFNDFIWVPCPGESPWDPYECAAFEDCTWLIEVCSPTGKTVIVPSYSETPSADNEWYPPGACTVTCRVLDWEPDRLGIFDGPPRYTKVIYIGDCSTAVATNSNGYRFGLPGGLWFNDARDFDWFNYNGKAAKQSWITNPVGSGEFGINIFGSDGRSGGYWILINP